jgi:hypothetical protein
VHDCNLRPITPLSRRKSDNSSSTLFLSIEISRLKNSTHLPKRGIPKPAPRAPSSWKYKKKVGTLSCRPRQFKRHLNQLFPGTCLRLRIIDRKRYSSWSSVRTHPCGRCEFDYGLEYSFEIMLRAPIGSFHHRGRHACGLAAASP